MTISNLEELVRTPGFVENPYAAYALLRDGDHDGQSSSSFGHQVYFRHQHVSAVLRNSGFGQEHPLTPSASRRPLVRMNPPEHTRLRALLTTALTPRSVHGLRPRVESLTDELIWSMTRTRSADLVADFARMLPITVICELLGVPAADRGFVARTSADITARPDAGEKPTAEQTATRRRSSKALRGYFRDLIRQRREKPGLDLVTRLLDAERDGDRMDDTDVVASCVLLLVAGHTTTTDFIANSALALLCEPDQLATLLSMPPSHTTWVEELLRYEAPIQMMSRVAVREFTFESRSFHPGDQVIVVLGSANRDPTAFEHPDELNLLRASGRHLSLGMGIHSCLGAQLARLEGEVAIRALARHLVRARFDPADVRWRRDMVHRGPIRLPVNLNSTSTMTNIDTSIARREHSGRCSL